MSYVKSLQAIRKQISTGTETPQPDQVNSFGRGLLQKVQQTQPAPELRYDPNQYALDTIKKIQESRKTMQAKMLENTKEYVASLEQSKNTPIRIIDKKEEAPPVEQQEPHAARVEAGYTSEEPNTEVRNDPQFMAGVNAIATKYNTSPEAILAVMHFETGGSFDPSTRNAVGSGATGLIQFVPATAKGLGTTTDQIAKMGRSEQLALVDEYLSGTGLSGNKENQIEDVYMAVLYPKAVGKPLSYPLFKKGTKQYEQNAGLDQDGDGIITKADASAKVRAIMEKYRG